MGSEPKKKSYAGLITGAIAGVAVVGLVAGGIGGAVGYLAASNAASPEAATVSTPVVAEPEAATGSSTPVLTGIADLAAQAQPAVVQMNGGDVGQGGTGSGFLISEEDTSSRTITWPAASVRTGPWGSSSPMSQSPPAHSWDLMPATTLPS